MLIIDDRNGITLTRGDSAKLRVLIQDENGEAYDYSGDTVKFGVKRSAYDAACVLEKTVTDGKITLTPADTEKMEFGDYLYDVEVRHTEGSGSEAVTDVYTPIAAARFRLSYNVL